MKGSERTVVKLTGFRRRRRRSVSDDEVWALLGVGIILILCMVWLLL